MQRKKMFLVVCISALLAGGVRGQNFLPGKGKWIPEYRGSTRENFHFSAIPEWDLSGKGKPEWSRVLPDRSTEIIPWRAQVVIPADRVATHFGFFCRRELELEKTIRLPLRFRLGSLEYCNKLEGK